MDRLGSRVRGNDGGGTGMTVGAGVDALDRGAFIEIDDAALDAYLAAGTLLAIRTAITLSRVPSVRLARACQESCVRGHNGAHFWA